MKRFLLLALFTPFSVAACSGKAQDSTGVGNPGLTQSEQALYDDGDDGRKAGDTATALTQIPLLGLVTAGTLANETVAAGAGELGKKAFTPDTCVTTVRTTNVVTFTFTDCRYALGYAHVNGKIQATYSPSATTGAIDVDIKTVDVPFTLETYRKLAPLTVTVTVDTHATVQFTDTNIKQIDWNGTYVATWTGGSLTHKPAYRTIIDTRVPSDTCVDLDGTASTVFENGRGVDVAVVGYHRCGTQTACPAAGGSVTFTSHTDPTLTLKVEFLGGRAVRVTPPKRPPRPDTFELDDLLQCTG